MTDAKSVEAPLETVLTMIEKSALAAESALYYAAHTSTSMSPHDQLLNGAVRHVVQQQKPKKKRIRRQMEELKHLRLTVKELEDRLTNLRKISTTSQSKVSIQPQSSPEVAAMLASVWESVAERQAKERQRAEQENAQLKSMLVGQIKMARNLEKIVKKKARPVNTNLTMEAKCLKHDFSITEGLKGWNLEDQLATLHQAYVEVDTVIRAVGLNDIEPDFHELQVKTDEVNGTRIEFLACIRIPFDRDVTANALWRFLARDGLRSQCYYMTHNEITEDIVMRSFGIAVQDGDQTGECHGKLTFRKYEEIDRTVMVGAARLEPQIANAVSYGIRFRDIGRVILQKDDASESPATIVKVYCRLVPDVEDDTDTLDQNGEIGALTKFVVGVAKSKMTIICDMIKTMVLEEDWKSYIEPFASAESREGRIS